jgi:hypothetical protein
VRVELSLRVEADGSLSKRWLEVQSLELSYNSISAEACDIVREHVRHGLKENSPSALKYGTLVPIFINWFLKSAWAKRLVADAIQSSILGSGDSLLFSSLGALFPGLEFDAPVVKASHVGANVGTCGTEAAALGGVDLVTYARLKPNAAVADRVQECSFEAVPEGGQSLPTAEHKSIMLRLHESAFNRCAPRRRALMFACLRARRLRRLPRGLPAHSVLFVASLWPSSTPGNYP